MRRRIYLLLENNAESKFGRIYDFFMIFVILFSLLPLAFRENNLFFSIIEYFSVSVFLIDYLLRWVTADFVFGKGTVSFLIYPFTGMAIIDLVSMLPSLRILNASFRVLRIVRLFRCLRVFRTAKLLRYSKNIAILLRVFQKQKKILGCVGSFALAYIVISALVIFNVEPETFPTFFDAIYWATVSLTTMGYGDIYPVSVAGRFVTIFSAVFGIAIIALPSGILTAGYMEEIHQTYDNDEQEEEK